MPTGDRNRMKQRLDGLPFLRSGAFAALIGLGVLSGCSTSSIDDIVPSAANAPTSGQAEPAATAETASSGAPKNTGTFPNLNIPPQVANEQLTPEEKAAQVAALRAAQQEHAATSAAAKDTTDPVLLRKLAVTHAPDALKEIEGQCEAGSPTAACPAPSN
jgi:hypothetical protein